MDTYQIMFSVNLYHTYYRDGICKGLTIKPDNASALLMQKNGMIFRASKEGFSVYSKNRQQNDSIPISETVDRGIQLNFQLDLNDPYFLNITETGEPDTDESHLFSNQLVETNPENERESDLIFGKTIRISRGPYFTVDRINSQDRFEKDGQVYYLPAESSSTSPQYETTGLDAGIYKLISDEDPKYYYLEPTPLARKPFALISINLGDEKFVDEAGSAKQPVFAIRFLARKTYWQYIIIKNDNHPNLVIDGVGETGSFTRAEDIISDNRPAIVFTSKQKIPLTELRDDYFKLKTRQGDPAKDMILISKLPIPDGSNLIRNAEGKLVTSMYINL